MANLSLDKQASIQALLTQINVLQQESLEAVSANSRKVFLEIAIEKTNIISQAFSENLDHGHGLG